MDDIFKEELKSVPWLVEQGGKLRLAEKSLFVSNSILAELI